MKQFSLSDLLLIITLSLICICFIMLRSREKRFIIQKKVEKDLVEFIYNIFESHLDEKLIKVVEDILETTNNNCKPQDILEKLSKGYFDFSVNSMTIFQPDEHAEFLHPTVSVPPETGKENVKNNLTFYIGNNSNNFDTRGLAGFTYKTNELVKIYINQDREAWRVVVNEDNQTADEAFTHYRNIGVNEQISIHSTAAIPLHRKRNGKIEVLGVLCVNSNDEETFKSRKHDDKLSKVSRCLAIAIEIQDLLEEMH